MPHTRFGLGFITKFSPPAWQAEHDRYHARDWWTGDYFVDLAQQLEAACFDFLFFEDTQAVIRRLGDRLDADLKHSIYTPKHDPMPLLGRISGATERIGLIATASTSFYQPYMLARLLSVIDSMSQGRAGWNIVTSALDDEAQNYGMDAMPKGGERYDRAEDFVAACKELWDAWDADAVVMDPETGVHVDPAKVRTVDHVGPYYRVRGPLNVLPAPQRHPVLAQAGSSDRGRDFAAKHAEVVFGLAGEGAEVMRAFRDDMHRRMKAFGRDPRDLRIYWDAGVRITHPDDAPLHRFSGDRIEILLTYWAGFCNVDMSQFDLEQPFPEDYELTGIQGMMQELKDLGRRGLTLRESLIQAYSGDAVGLSGSADEVAENMAAAIDEVGGDGFMIRGGDVADAEWLRRITEELVPRLRDLDVVATDYVGSTFRDNLRGR